MSNMQLFQSKTELVGFISEYLIKHDDTIAIIKKDLRKDVIKSLLISEDFNTFKDLSGIDENVLFLIKTGDKKGKNLSIKICDAHNQQTKAFKMIDIDNILLVDGLITDDEAGSITYYKEITKMRLQ
ncbi:hypothetical protein [Clostridium estertheticum]|uniref:Uncharacterized protein n=2 Tax=Clostridium estertheticum TaxID=238834 RepID=A0A1J0GET0_9CLOT|nr:hypothetical protein [Clostridium estertheticum]APC39496.1 hypothetical protein A7L45_05165 [Clostridium estertheticum subsp. estertheticum]MBU3072176.1 hypothetical protein [Clostridium estertheticum]MBU3156148.1 hypothetical protein [Clostridium estertheticum]MBU3162268.1 hypothetical protein [Clostridium estertheticum]MBU3170699.1 hypothetical protein [Clostridium estertheticum]